VSYLVIILNLASMGLSGLIASEIAYLSYLETVDFSKNQLSSTIPTQIGQQFKIDQCPPKPKSDTGPDSNFYRSASRLEILTNTFQHPGIFNTNTPG